MHAPFRRKWAALIGMSAGWLMAFGCVTDAQFRDFLSSTLIRTFFQTIATAFQAALIDAAGNA